jgi:hypothetical protein
MGISAGFHLVETLPEEAHKERTSPAVLLREDIGVKPLKKPGAHFRIGLPGPEPADPIFFKDVITRKDLIRAFSREDNLVVVLTDQSRKLKHRDGSRSEDWDFRVPDNLRETFSYIFFCALDSFMVSLKGLNRFLLEWGFIKPIVCKAYGKRAELVIEMSFHHRGDISTIQPTAQVCPYGNIGS